jgi:hypothetical protein
LKADINQGATQMTYMNGKALKEFTKSELESMFQKLLFIADDEILTDILDAIKMREQFEKKIS